MTAVLSTILADVRQRLAERRRALPLTRLREHALVARRPIDFMAALEKSKPSVIAEVKRKSPSMGEIAAKADPVKVARQYISAGATALSVLTESDHFGGAPEVLTAIRERLPNAALLMKDFVVDVSQLLEARVWGADCVLLMVSVLGQDIAEYLALATGLGLTSLVEVHDADEMQIAVRAGAPLIGINNRNLKTMEVKLETGIALAAEAPKGAFLVAESGIATGADVKRLAKAGFRAFLVGTSLMRHGEPGEALEKLRREAAT